MLVSLPMELFLLNKYKLSCIVCLSPLRALQCCHIWTLAFLRRTGNKTELFSDLSGFPVLQERREQIQAVVSQIQDHRREIRRALKAPALDYVTVSGQEVRACRRLRLRVKDRREEIDGLIRVEE